ncbi:hypothetical protein K1720_04420 [Thermococcus argininiproducens]|uniref:Uncharacterized protein n=1 Tax=Thermococcus argininiproducens TaxID=2866384 RepID=A0A9E7SDJ7_9EURY|nr:hypothetical protein [Thermococcus argininiproducens]USH00687.1 hypothetical protein K1720_04420 [Thermococcus argininiproducens]
MGSISALGFSFIGVNDKLSGLVFVLVFLGFVIPFIWGNYKVRCKEAREHQDSVNRYLELRDNFKEYASEILKQHGLSYEDCVSEYKRLEKSTITEYLYHPLIQGLNHLSEGNFSEASEKFKFAKFALEAVSHSKIEHRTFDSHSPGWDWYIPPKNVINPLSFAARACDALYLGDVEKMHELLNEAHEMLDERDKFVIGDVKFFKYLFEFHYFLLKAVVEAYEAEMGAVAKATEEQAERLAKAKPVEVPAQVEKGPVSAEEPERELYRGEIRFKMGAMSQERVGTLVITNKRLRLQGKYRLRGMVATVAVKAALRAAGVGEIDEEISLKEISWLELKKGILGGHYLEFKAKGKKYTIYTDAAQHIYDILRQYQ